MSTQSSAYHAAPPRVLDFLRNYTRRHLACQGPWRIPPAWNTPEYFYTLGQAFTAYTTWDLWRSNYSAQLFEYGTVNPEQPMIVIPAGTWTGLPEPIWDPSGTWSRGSQVLVTPAHAVNYPRPYSKGRRHYWTGAPRKRRNL